MKKIILAVALVCSTIGFSQDKVSEGIITTKQTMSSDNEYAVGNDGRNDHNYIF